jgi:hypothetical protein
MLGGLYLNNGSKSEDKALQGRVAAIAYIFDFMVFMSIAVLPFYMLDRYALCKA